MIYTDTVFLLVYLPIVLLLYYVIGSRNDRRQDIILFMASIIFLFYSQSILACFILLSTVITWKGGMDIQNTIDANRSRRLWITISILSTFMLAGLLVTGPFRTWINNKIRLDDFVLIPEQGFALPSVMALIILAEIGYLADIYRKEEVTDKSYFKLLSYLIFFPKLLIGPLISYDSYLQKLEDRIISRDRFFRGCRRLAFGLIKKVLLADQFAVMADLLLQMTNTGHHILKIPFLLAWLGACATLLHIYFTWTAFYDMAIGLGLMFGVQFEEGYTSPVHMNSMADFWKCCNIPMGRWMKKYIYDPYLDKDTFLWKRFIQITFVIALLCAAIHRITVGMFVAVCFVSIIICLESLLSWNDMPLHSWLKRLIDMVFLLIAAVLFRCENYYQIQEYMGNLFFTHRNGIWSPYVYLFLKEYAFCWVIIILGITCGAYLKRKMEQEKRIVGKIVQVVIILLLLSLCIPFIQKQDMSGYAATTSYTKKIQNQKIAEQLSQKIAYIINQIPGKATSEKLTRAKDKENYSFETNFWNDVVPESKPIGVALRKLMDEQYRGNAGLGLVINPMKKVRREQAYYGVPYYDGSNEAETTLRWMRYYDIPYLDFQNDENVLSLRYDQIWKKDGNNWLDSAQELSYQKIKQWMDSENYRKHVNQDQKTAILLVIDSSSGLLKEYFAKDYQHVDTIDIGRINENRLNRLMEENDYNQILFVIKADNLQSQFFTFRK